MGDFNNVAISRAINVGTVLGARNREKWRFDFIGNPPADVGAWSTRPMSESRSTTDADEADNCLDNLKNPKNVAINVS